MKFHLLLLSMISLHCYGVNDVEVKNWKADLEFYAKEMPEKHIDLYHTISKQSFNEEVTQLKSSLPSLTKNQCNYSATSSINISGN